MRTRTLVLGIGSLVLLTSATLTAGLPAIAATGYSVTPLTADKPGAAAHTDAHLVNPWGIAFSPTGPFWLADNNGNVSTVYDGTGTAAPLVVYIPAPAATTGGTPTGVVFNPAHATDFTVTSGGNTAGAIFIFATEDGTLSGWAPTVDATHAIVRVNRSNVPSADKGAVYKGLAFASWGGKNRLYATNFRAGKVEVFNALWNKVSLPGNFTDPSVPSALSPFGIQAIGGMIYVTYAMPGSDRHDDESGPGVGAVSVFNPDGTLASSLVHGGALNSPWGVTLAPASFGALGGDLLVGNFGDGRINAFNPATGTFAGTVSDLAGSPLVTAGLWGLSFGNGGGAGSASTLYFTAGTGGEKDGLFGAINPVATTPQLPAAGRAPAAPGAPPLQLVLLAAALVIAVLGIGPLMLTRGD